MGRFVLNMSVLWIIIQLTLVIFKLSSLTKFYFFDLKISNQFGIILEKYTLVKIKNYLQEDTVLEQPLFQPKINF